MTAVETRTLIPVEEYKVLHKAAAAHGTTVGALVAELVHRGLQPGVAPPTTVRRRNTRVTPDILNTLVRMHSNGATDTEIARQTGMSMANVQKRRERLDLPPNHAARRNIRTKAAPAAETSNYS